MFSHTIMDILMYGPRAPTPIRVPSYNNSAEINNPVKVNCRGQESCLFFARAKTKLPIVTI